MICKNLPIIPFKTFFVSRELSICPQLADIIDFCKNISEKELLNKIEMSVSISYGRRILIYGMDASINKIKQDDIVEIIDYDPIKNNILAIGRKEPCIDTPVHCIIQNARNDVNAVFLIKNKTIFGRLSNRLSSTKNDAAIGSIDLAKEVLLALREDKNILIKNQGALFVGVNLKEIEDSVSKLLKGD